ncbi:dienelactone hydrolase [Aulosira sp. FACHB-615]|uniref:dienelactone hydrolase n=1 Tax=Aulosira sp. FACHB-615 TaxID=2692777 RepID=UPI001689E1EC|nr:dienelactone hydrolase [Aulosira sp. FACHB-615]MBD2487685.1 dienelactone hydrolase [Aulosira sp. FACHB-615]
MKVRAFFQAATVENISPPYNSIHLKVFYPEPEQNLSLVATETQASKFPVVILFNGINCGPEMYQWLAVKLAEFGLVIVTFSWIAENLPGFVAMTPGVDLSMLAPDNYGQGATASALPTLLKTLERLQVEGILAGLLDLDKIILGGHSAGGKVAIESADPKFCSQVVAAFAYGAHTAATVQLGYKAGTILSLPDSLPLLLIGGTCDGVIANSSNNYGVTWEQPTTPIIRTFQEAIAGGRNDSYLLILEGANHFSVTHPLDTTISRQFLDFPATQQEAELRDLIAQIIRLFIDAHVRYQTTALEALNQMLVAQNPLIASFNRK